MTTESRVHARALTAFGHAVPNALVLSADLTSSTEADDFREEFPERFISMGMAEQNMMSVAGGLAREGYIPLCHDFAVFMYRRALDQIEMSAAYPNLPVIMVGFLPGITTPGGVSHQAINDVAVMRSIPNMTILECGDVSDVESVLPIAAERGGPVYVRMIRGEIPRLFPTPMTFNTARVLETGDELVILSSGVCTEPTIAVVRELREQGVDVAHLHVTTLKPFDDPIVKDFLSRAKRGVLTVENHSVIGGLGSAVASVMAEHAISVPLRTLGMQDTYGHGSSKSHLMTYYGIDTDAIYAAASELAGNDALGTRVRSTSMSKEASSDPLAVTQDEAL